MRNLYLFIKLSFYPRIFLHTHYRLLYAPCSLDFSEVLIMTLLLIFKWRKVLYFLSQIRHPLIVAQQTATGLSNVQQTQTRKCARKQGIAFVAVLLNSLPKPIWCFQRQCFYPAWIDPEMVQRQFCNNAYATRCLISRPVVHTRADRNLLVASSRCGWLAFMLDSCRDLFLVEHKTLHLKGGKGGRGGSEGRKKSWDVL